MIFIPNEIGLYIHIPWCFKKCPYCDLNAYTIHKKFNQKIYIKKMIQDLLQSKYLIQNKIIKSIFIGGGTPNIINYKLFSILLQKVKNIIYIDSNAEITIEIHPEFITLQDILQYIKIGINRISLGIQSFNNKILKSIGRTNSSKKSIELLNNIKKYTSIKFNIDLMYGLPNQTIQDCLIDLQTAIKINPHHISWYQLNIEKNTIFYYQKPKTPTENTIYKMYNKGKSLLLQANYQQYEISSYAKSNYFCYHNLNYWQYGDYLGIGCGAHSKLTQDNKNIIRIIKKTRIDDYYNSIRYIESIKSIHKNDQPCEYFMNVFRTLQPINKKNLSLYTNINIQDIQPFINKAITKKYIKETKNHWYLLPKGQLFFNNLIMLFIDYKYD